MDLWQTPVVDARPQLTAERADLLDLLDALAPEAWPRVSAAAPWTVQDLALHLLDNDLRWLSRDRDADLSGLVDMTDRAGFVQALAADNQRWVDGARGLSRRVVIDLLRWSGQQLDEHLDGVDLRGPVGVSWASDRPVPVWFDVCRELTERWVHQQQLREAVGQPGRHAERYLTDVLRTFVWAVPHQYRAPAEAGTAVRVVLEPAGTWHLTATAPGRWELDEGPGRSAAAELATTPDTAWRWLTGAAYDEGSVTHRGDPALSRPLLAVRGIIV